MVKRLFSLFLAIVFVCCMGVVAYAEEGESPLISQDNPLSGEKITYIFLDDEENVVATEGLVYNQIIYIIDRHGNELREYAVRQLSRITMPSLRSEEGWVFDYWKTYYKGRAFYLEPVYRIELTIKDHEGNGIVKLTCDTGHAVNVYDRTGESLMSNTYTAPTTITLSAPPELPHYVFRKWETANETGAYEIRAVYDSIIYFNDPDGNPLFNVTLPIGYQFHVTDAQNTVVDSYVVGDAQTIVLQNPAAIEGKEFFNWGTQQHDNMLYIVPAYGEPLGEKEKAPQPVHVGFVNDTRLPDTSSAPMGDLMQIDEENNKVIINGVALPMALITWGVPAVLFALIAGIFLLIRSRKKKKAAKSGDTEPIAPQQQDITPSEDAPEPTEPKKKGKQKKEKPKKEKKLYKSGDIAPPEPIAPQQQDITPSEDTPEAPTSDFSDEGHAGIPQSEESATQPVFMPPEDASEDFFDDEMMFAYEDDPATAENGEYSTFAAPQPGITPPEDTATAPIDDEERPGE